MDTPSIIIVEDNQTLRRLLEYRVGKLYDVRTAEDGEQALQLIDDGVPDLIISDIMMPKMDGYSVLGRLRRKEQFKLLPVIMLTAKGEASEIIKAQYLDATDYLIKPFELKSLLKTIERHLKIRK